MSLLNAINPKNATAKAVKATEAAQTKDSSALPCSAQHLKVLSHPNPHLNQKAEAVDIEKPEELQSAQELIEALYETMQAENGAGLAAVQVGIPVRIFVYAKEDDSLAALINPVIESMSDETVLDDEGCLSFPELYAPVSRAQQVMVSGHDSNGRAVTLTARDFLARVFQHEIDHLDGITFVDRLSAEDKKLALRSYFEL